MPVKLLFFNDTVTYNMTQKIQQLPLTFYASINRSKMWILYDYEFFEVSPEYFAKLLGPREC